MSIRSISKTSTNVQALPPESAASPGGSGGSPPRANTAPAGSGGSPPRAGTAASAGAVTAPAEAVRLAGVSKRYGSGARSVLALDQVSLTVGQGEFVCLIGASGCGKSTLLSLVAGLDAPTSGEIAVGGRRVAMMFQEPGLLPWLTAGANVELALRARGVPRAQRRQRTTELLAVVRLTGFGARRPHELSGGMRQRVALARALAQDADVLLMDEPFGALDAMTRDLLHDELDRICREQSLTVLFVTHNVREAVRLGDRVIVLSSRPGRVIEEYQIPGDQPRGINTPQTAQLAATITDRLRGEMGRHGS